MKSKLLNDLARETVGDCKQPNLYFVTDKGDCVMVTSDREAAYQHWRKLANHYPRQECVLEDRFNGVICSVAPSEEGSKKLVIYNDYMPVVGGGGGGGCAVGGGWVVSHTPVPWTVKECRDGVYAGLKCLVATESGFELVGPRQLGYPTVPMGHMEANAEFICRAVNCHEDLLEALRLAAQQLDEAASAMSESDFALQTAENCAERAMLLRAAIAKATGGAQ